MSDGQWRAASKPVRSSAHPPLYELGGYKNAGEFFQKELGVNDRVGRTYVRVAEHATPAQEDELGVFRLDAALGWIEATKGPLSPHTPVDFARVKVAGKPLAACTVAFIKEQTARARGKKGARAPKAYRDALSKVFAKHAAFRALRIREAHGKTSFHGVPNASLRAFAEVLLEARLPK